MKSFQYLSCVIIAAGLFIFSTATLYAQGISSHDIDNLVEKTMQSFNVPGIAVAVVKDDKIVHMKGYGVSSIVTKEKTDENTLFAIASNSKAFTAAALAILVDEEKITWETRVIDIIPEFKLYDPYVTSEFTIKDLLTHRSGLGLGAGDLMLWPDGSYFTLKDIIHNMRYLKPVSSFRTKYDYDNLLYIVAGEIVARVSGMSWDEFVESRIMSPLGMDMSATCYKRLKDKRNVIDAHVTVQGTLQRVPMNFTSVGNAAGGIFSSVSDLSKWVMMQLNGGKYGKDLSKSIFSQKASREMWSPQTIIQGGGSGYKTNFSAYALGWRVNDINGYKQVSHTGGLSGVVTQVTMIPELKLGIIVLTNQQASGAFVAITNTIKDSYIGVYGKDRLKENLEITVSNLSEAHDVVSKIWARVANSSKFAPGEVMLRNYTGKYKDNWFGNVNITLENGELRFSSEMSPLLKGVLCYYIDNTFVVKWDERSFDADAFIKFSKDFDGNPDGFVMKAISPETDFSYDFQDLDFKKVK
ncbi:MAG: serine hydrolase [Rikenellaceae bacterium]|nr:serine hydrolase [Rikenellaceae bacterium]